MKSNNPVLTRLPQAQQNTGYAQPQGGYPQQNPYGQTQYGQTPNFGYAQQQGYGQPAERPITVDDIVSKTGAIRVTPKFTRILTGCIIGVAVLALGNLLLFIFTGMSPLRDGGPIAIGFSLVCIVLGALSFLTDFDTADKLVRTGAPAKMAWGVALGLAVTLVWLYTEILRLLSYFRD